MTTAKLGNIEIFLREVRFFRVGYGDMLVPKLLDLSVDLSLGISDALPDHFSFADLHVVRRGCRKGR
jgi:hypothetical protein